MSPLFRKSEKQVAERAAVDAEVARLRAISAEEMALMILPGLGRDGLGQGHNVRPQQLCIDLLRDFPGAGQLRPLDLLSRVRAALEVLQRAGLVGSVSYERSPVWRITDVGETALAEGTTGQRIGHPDLS